MHVTRDSTGCQGFTREINRPYGARNISRDKSKVCVEKDNGNDICVE